MNLWNSETIVYWNFGFSTELNNTQKRNCSISSGSYKTLIESFIKGLVQMHIYGGYYTRRDNNFGPGRDRFR